MKTPTVASIAAVLFLCFGIGVGAFALVEPECAKIVFNTENDGKASDGEGCAPLR